MRRIGSLADESLARRFCNYLVTISVDATVDRDGDGAGTVWNIWVRDENDIERARDELAHFKTSPEDRRFDVDEQAAKILDERVNEQLRRQRQNRQRAALTTAPSAFGTLTAAKQRSIPITIGIIMVSTVLSLWTNFADPRPSRVQGRFSAQQETLFALSFVDRREYSRTGDPFASLREGQIWRIITPMFIHSDILHLFFNMVLLFIFGSALERLHGSIYMLLLVLGTQTAGMMLQVLLPDADFIPEPLRGSPFAFGASGAVYGLFGFLWIRPNIDPSYPIHMLPINIVIMLGWLILCMTPLFPRIANGAHLGGLIGGIIAAYLGYAFRRWVPS